MCKWEVITLSISSFFQLLRHCHCQHSTKQEWIDSKSTLSFLYLTSCVHQHSKALPAQWVLSSVVKNNSENIHGKTTHCAHNWPTDKSCETLRIIHDLYGLDNFFSFKSAYFLYLKEVFDKICSNLLGYFQLWVTLKLKLGKN